MAAPSAQNWDLTAVNNALKEYYSKQPVAQAAYDQSKLCLLNPAKFKLKRTKAAGNSFVRPVRYSQSGGLGMTVTTANNAARESDITRWVLSGKKIFKSDSIDTEVIWRANGDPAGAFFQAAKDVIDWARNDLAVELERRLFGNGSGQIGVVSSASANVITLKTASDARNFEVGMSVVGDNGTTVTQVTAVNRSAGTITVTSDTDMDTEDDVIYRYGFYQSDAEDGIQGLGRCFPTTRTSTDYEVHGVELSTDWNRLAGTLSDRTGATPYEALMDGVMEAKANGGDPTAAVMSYENLAALINDAQGQKLFGAGDAGVVGFRVLEVATPDGGMVKILGSQFCSSNQIYLLNEPDLEFVHWGNEVMNVEDIDGSLLHWNYSSSQWDVRHQILGDLLVNTPSKHGVIKLA